MRSIIGGFIVAWTFLGGLSASGQDLGQLQARVSKLWELRQQSNKLDALPLIEPQTRQTYLLGNESPILSFKLLGLEFDPNNDPNRVDVLVKVHSVLLQLGEIDRTVREPWVWKDGQWFMLAMSPPKLFESAEKSSAPVHVPPAFHVASTTVDIGRHVQGETIQGKIPFQAVRRDIVVIRPLHETPGLSIGAPVWTSPSEGYLPYQWETILLPRDVDQKATLEATATSNERASVDIRFRARIDVKIGFKQVPEIIDPSKAGKAELQIQNLSDKPVKILTIFSNNRTYVLEEGQPDSSADRLESPIQPGKSRSLWIDYPAQSEPTGASLGLVLSEPLGQPGQSPITTVPLRIKMPEQQPASVNREDLEKIINTVPKPNLPPRKP